MHQLILLETINDFANRLAKSCSVTIEKKIVFINLSCLSFNLFTTYLVKTFKINRVINRQSKPLKYAS